ncbi:hypothetical protein P171DRAFT_452385 [Karstenula rhodostoma CBS 690.94]|uniref:GEgh 16 protein n=1 Tax=Karstenula rhodostoma CBS 690.94 TaxID=1392251 RepID=A0A9P4UGJ3_9PLEO|nr:hypothetical protein P171DRAFT_452385 [Karstenula rhodostoma CBS 690.94]
MHYQISILALAAIFSSVQAHGTIESAIGESGESKGFKVDDSLARNCTGISPCQQDTTIIRDSEITQNIVNSCGRTEIDGNIDVGGETEKAIAANKVTTVKRGSQLAVTIHQVNADGAGPYECDLDVTSNAATSFVQLQVTNNVPGANGLSQAEATDFTINVQMPDDFNCVGASTGDICTVRCRNTAVAGPFGGCFPVQQTDGTGRADNQTADSVTTAQTLDGINKQIAQNKKDLPAAIAAIAAAGAVGGNADASRVSALVPAASQTAAAGTGNAATGNTGNANTGNGNNGNGRNRNNGNGNAANAADGNAANGNAANGNAANENAGNGQAANGNGQAANGNGQAANGNGQAANGNGQAANGSEW